MAMTAAVGRMAEQAGTRLGPYRLVAPIGSGGFATVYRAVDERLDSEVAIKILAENHALDIEVRERFLSEARLLRRVACEAVVPVFDIGENDRAQPYIVLAYADRGDLRDRVTQRSGSGNPVNNDDLATVADTLAVALGRAHRVGLVHRDVKPTNLLIASTKGEAQGRPLGRSPLLAHEERLLLGDLGLAKDLSANSGLTVGGGTHGFNAPEQRTGVGRVDVRADVYGASAVLFWMATKAVPTDDENERAERLAQASVSEEMVAGISQGLAADPNDRFADIESWHAGLGLEASAKSGSVAVARSGHGEPSGTTGQLGQQKAVADEAASSATPKRRWASAAAALIGAIAIGGIGYAMLNADSSSVTELDDGNVQVIEQRDDLTAAVSGPATVDVGQSATFEASASGAASFRWFTPDGLVREENPLTISSSIPGEALLTLVASDQQGRTTSVEFEFTVTEPQASE